jgi:uncharacterized protein YoxC
MDGLMDGWMDGWVDKAHVNKFLLFTEQKAKTLIAKESLVVLPFIGKANATLNELKALIKETASELKVCLDKDGIKGALCVVDVLSKKKPEAEEIAKDIKLKVKQGHDIVKKIVSDVKEAVKSFAESAKQSVKDIKAEIEQCIRDKLQS